MMMTETRPVTEGTAYQKAYLIQDALATLRTANQIDERDDLTTASFLEWYDRTIPGVKDIKILAGAMEIELGRRRGEQILQEGEQRGGDTKVSSVDTLLSDAMKVQRSKDRALATAPKAVQAFVQREVKAGRVPAVNGAVRMARIATACRGPKGDRRTIDGPQNRKQATHNHILAVLTQVADGTRRTMPLLTKLTGFRDVETSFLERIRLIPWLRIDRTADGLAFHIDEPLRAICEGRLPRPTLSYQSTDQFLRNLRAEITRRRKENHDELLKRRWNSELILKREQTSLLDWIEQELDRVPSL